MAETASVVVVEDDAPTRARLAAAVMQTSGLRLAGAAADCAEARRLLLGAMPNVLLVDLGLPDGDGAELIAEAIARNPHTQAMVITVFGDETHVVRAIEAGATGYLLKDASTPEIGRAIGEMLAGGSPISSAVARHVLNRLQASRGAAPGTAQEEVALTPREADVLRLIAKGCSYSEVAAALGLSVNTVAFHIKQIYRKLAVNSRGEAVFEASSMGLLPGTRTPRTPR